LALVRGDLDAIHELLPDVEWFRRQTWFALPAAAVRLDAIAVVGDEDAVAAEQLLQPTGYLEPFKLRALGLIRNDDALLERANAGFGALRLGWHAQQTETLRRFRKLVAG
jgi:hypothetical protein